MKRRNFIKAFSTGVIAITVVPNVVLKPSSKYYIQYNAPNRIPKDAPYMHWMDNGRLEITKSEYDEISSKAPAVQAGHHTPPFMLIIQS